MSDLPFTAFDVAVTVIVLLSVLIAVTRGFLREVMSVSSWVAAIAAALLLYPQVRPYAGAAIAQPLLADLATGLAVFLVPLILFRMLTGMLAEGLVRLGLGGLDRLLGLAFGAVRGALIVSAAYLAGTYIADRQDFPLWVREARLEPPVRDGAEWLGSMLPQGLAQNGRATVQGALDRARDRRGADTAPEVENVPAEREPGYTRDTREQMDKLLEEKVR